MSVFSPLFLKMGMMIDSFHPLGVICVFPQNVKKEAKTDLIAEPPNLYASAPIPSEPPAFPQAVFESALSTSS